MYELAKEQLATQLQTVAEIYSKIGMLVSLASALVGIVAAVYALRAATKSGVAPALSGGQIATLVIGAITYLVILWFGMKAYFVTTWHGPPTLDSIWEKQESDRTDDLLKWEVAKDFVSSYDHNQRAFQTKLFALKVVFAGVIVESLVVVTSLFLVATGA